MVACLASPLAASRQASAQDPSATTGIDTSRFDLIRPTIERAIADKKLPGAVVLVGRGDRVLDEKAVGNRSIEPAAEPMTEDTVFDLASLTKVIATTTSVMQLMEDGQIRMTIGSMRSFRISSATEDHITIRHLMTHTSGFRPGSRARRRVDRPRRRSSARSRKCRRRAPGERFVYSDINYFLLGDIVRRVSGQPRSNSRAHRFRAAGDEGHDVSAAGTAAGAHRADREVHTVWLPVRGLEFGDAARRRARSDGQTDGWCCGSRACSLYVPLFSSIWQKIETSAAVPKSPA